MAFVVLHPQHVASWHGRHHIFADELKAHAKTRLPGFACPEWVEVVPELPVRPPPFSTNNSSDAFCLENLHRQDFENRAAQDCHQVMNGESFI